MPRRRDRNGLLVPERRAEIVRLIEQRGSARVGELSHRFGVTEETIRRDLEELEREGVLRRTYGGAVGMTHGSSHELPHARREEKNREQKERIAAAAAGLVQDGETIAVDASTTALELVRRLQAHQNLTLLTNSVQIVWELARHSGIQVISTGGTLRGNSLSFVGPLAERALTEYHVDKAILSCKGLSLQHGLTDSNELEVELKKRMVQAAAQVIALVDSSKLGYVGFSRIIPISGIHTLVTDSGIQPNIRRELEERGVKVRVAD